MLVPSGWQLCLCSSTKMSLKGTFKVKVSHCTSCVWRNLVFYHICLEQGHAQTHIIKVFVILVLLRLLKLQNLALRSSASQELPFSLPPSLYWGTSVTGASARQSVRRSASIMVRRLEHLSPREHSMFQPSACCIPVWGTVLSWGFCED